jgi:hypothetical protein
MPIKVTQENEIRPAFHKTRIGSNSIMEYGENSNGQYIRFYNGFQMIRQAYAEDKNWYGHNFTFPAEFAPTEEPIVTVEDSSANHFSTCGSGGVGPSYDGFTFYLTRWDGTTGNSTGSFTGRYMAVGLWRK